MFSLKNLLHIPRSPKPIERLDEHELAYARQQRSKEIRMWSIIHEFSFYVLFIVFISLITFSNRDGNQFYQVKHLRNYFFNTRQKDQTYTKVHDDQFSSEYFSMNGLDHNSE